MRERWHPSWLLVLGVVSLGVAGLALVIVEAVSG